MPAFLDTQNFLSDPNIPKVGGRAKVENLENSYTSNGESASFSQLLNKSKGTEQATTPISELETSAEDESGNSVDQAASHVSFSGNNLPIDNLILQNHNLQQGSESGPSVDVNEVSIHSNRYGYAGNSTMENFPVNTNTQNQLTDTVEAISENERTLTGLKEASGLGANQTNLSSEQSKLLDLPVYSNTNSDNRYVLPGNQSSQNNQGFQQPQQRLLKSDQAIVASTNGLSNVQEPSQQANHIADLEFNRSKTKVAESITDTKKPVDSDRSVLINVTNAAPIRKEIGNRSSNSTSNSILNFDFDQLSERILGAPKSMTKDSLKDLNANLGNQGLRPAVLPVIESPELLNREIFRVMNGQPANALADPISMSKEEIDSSYLRTQPTVSKTPGLSSVFPSSTQTSSTLNAHINSQAWSQDFGQQIVLFTQKDIKQANLQLNPQHLGPLEVRINIGSEQQVNVSFNTQHGMVKEAIDNALPRLREMFEQQGLSLGDVNVSQHFGKESGKQQHGKELFHQDPSNQGFTDSNDDEQIFVLTNTQSTNLVDFFA